ncbi:MAG: 2-oxo acid dehydrogenase subunit E2 [Deltaproteobacteria bacterium]|nr:2-oxo acid dehydrogenase subunit E2 [Deltaproteobacteria bacterium]
MPTNVIMPALGVAQQTGTLLKWLKAEGQSVTKGEPLMEIETDKATVEIEAAASGVLSRVTAKAGDEVPVGQTIALILAPGELAPQSPHPSPLPKGEGITQGHPLPQGEGRGEGRATTTTTTMRDLSTAPSGGRILASPKAKRIAKERGIELSSLRGSGPEGTILAADVQRAANENVARPAASTAPGLLPLTPMRRIVGQRMTQSKQSAPHFYISMDIDMTAVTKLRNEAKDRGDESIPSINDFILQAAARALKDLPSMNSSFTEQGIQQHADINIGVAVALEEGLVVPVIRNADKLSLSELAKQSRALADKAQNKRLFPLDYEGGTFTVSNLGMLGVDSFIAIINPPQCAILAVGRVAPRVVTDGDGIEIKSIMTATLSADHRIVDGASAARFLRQVKQALETPAV